MDINKFSVYSWQEIVYYHLGPLPLTVEPEAENALVVANILWVPLLMMSVWNDLSNNSFLCK